MRMGIKDLLDKFYPEDLKDYMNGRVYISLSDVDRRFKPVNRLVSKFDTREECLDSITASCLAPGWGGFSALTINGRKFVDGGLTTNLPNLYPGETIRVQPFSTSAEYSEVSPIFSLPEDSKRFLLKDIDRNNTYTMYLTRRNLDRAAIKALFPPSNEEWYIELMNEGYHNTIQYLDSVNITEMNKAI